MATDSDREHESHHPNTQERPGVPRWVKIFALVALAVVLGFVIVMLFGGEHGPGMHSSAPESTVSMGMAGILA
ncbi:hypothetical protein [uncultured Arthrobacter sp.]|uniref:hypothetical protein n=1 Tax=uncultured Arthrobacter sp. TaxID=114050 RepID=UPI00261AE964|nr:hypothetical protein [uncultured Arthrobacter sp.]